MKQLIAVRFSSTILTKFGVEYLNQIQLNFKKSTFSELLSINSEPHIVFVYTTPDIVVHPLEKAIIAIDNLEGYSA